jgi:hypothetical protein
MNQEAPALYPQVRKVGSRLNPENLSGVVDKKTSWNG